MFITEEKLHSGSWQFFERVVARLLLLLDYEGIRLVGQTGDKGADIIAHKYGKRWLFQIKHWKQKVGAAVIDETLSALRLYRADIPVIVSLNGFEESVYRYQTELMSRQIPIQLWSSKHLIEKSLKLNLAKTPSLPQARDYQEEAIRRIVQTFTERTENRALVAMATGLGKTFVSGESIRRINKIKAVKVLVVVHTNELVYQIEKAFCRFLTPEQSTTIWNGYEQPDEQDLQTSQFIFACLNSIANYVSKRGELPEVDILLIDECHHVGGQMYDEIIKNTRAGEKNGPFLFGLTATPWRADDVDLQKYFGSPLVSVDIVTGLRNGYLANVDYRMFTDNIDWKKLRDLKGNSFSPNLINRTLFITDWDDAVITALRKVWDEVKTPKAIVFCGTIDHAIAMRDMINSFRFCNAEAIYSQARGGLSQSVFERNRILCDFHDGAVNIVCAVDIFNEGVDVPDVNIIVFQRVTHSRRIFIQQLGRGLRISPDKDKVIVLDFVSDIRRFAAGLSLKDDLSAPDNSTKSKPVRIKLPNKVTFQRVGGSDPDTETFLRQWIDDVAAIEAAGEMSSVLKFPPIDLIPSRK